MRRLLCFVLFFLSATYSMADNLPIPRFASLRSETVYMRAGPGERFPIEWVYEKKDFPVKIIDSFEHWLKIEDVDKNQGWVHKRMLSGKKTALTPKDEKTAMYKKASTQSKVLVYFEGQVIVKIIECEDDSAFCEVKYNELKGYIPKKSLYGASLTEGSGK